MKEPIKHLKNLELELINIFDRFIIYAFLLNSLR